MRTGTHAGRDGAQRGRGAQSNPPNRFELRREPVDDGWRSVRLEDDSGACRETFVREESAHSLIASNDSPDIPFRRSINPYRGCEHGCIYCYARPYHAYLGLSPGLDFESRIVAKIDAVERLRQELSSSAWRCEPIGLGTVTDVYQPIERGYRLTRGLVEVMSNFRQPFSVLTKSSLVERDIDLLAPMARDGLVHVSLTLTTLDPELARRWEPRAAAPWRRLQTLRRLHEAGIPVGVSVAPVVPFLNEPELERVLAAAREAGARTAFYSALRLPWELRDLFTEWLGTHYPDRARRVLRRVFEMRGKVMPGRAAEPGGTGGRPGTRFGGDGTRFSGEGAWAELLRLRFELTLRRLGYDREYAPLRTDLFRPPPAGCTLHGSQLGLF